MVNTCICGGGGLIHVYVEGGGGEGGGVNTCICGGGWLIHVYVEGGG